MMMSWSLMALGLGLFVYGCVRISGGVGGAFILLGMAAVMFGGSLHFQGPEWEVVGPMLRGGAIFTLVLSVAAFVYLYCTVPGTSSSPYSRPRVLRPDLKAAWFRQR